MESLKSPFQAAPGHHPEYLKRPKIGQRSSQEARKGAKRMPCCSFLRPFGLSWQEFGGRFAILDPPLLEPLGPKCYKRAAKCSKIGPEARKRPKKVENKPPKTVVFVSFLGSAFESHLESLLERSSDAPPPKICDFARDILQKRIFQQAAPKSKKCQEKARTRPPKLHKNC